MESFERALCGVCDGLRSALMKIKPRDKQRIFEIRLRCDRPVMLTLPEGSVFLTMDGTLRFAYAADCLFATEEDVRRCFDLICEHSLQTHENELRQGYISMKHGHRAGISGEGLMRNGAVVTFRKITGINIRIARQITGIAAPVMRRLYDRFGAPPGTLIFGPPGCGKTTLLRDMAAQLAQSGRRVVLIDEKGELTGINGDLDVITGIDKATAAEMAVRNLNPEYILFDEIGNMREAMQVQHCMNCGVRIITTMHAGSFAELMGRSIAQSIRKTGAIRGLVYLQRACREALVLDWEDECETTGHCTAVPDRSADQYDEKPLS